MKGFLAGILNLSTAFFAQHSSNKYLLIEAGLLPLC